MSTPLSTMPHRPPRRTTRTSVRVMDAAARIGISVGGVAVIIAVLGIMVYLVVSVLPLFRQGETSPLARHTIALPGEAIAASADEYLGAVQILLLDGRRVVVDVASGTTSELPAPPGKGRRITAISRPNDQGRLAIGYDDGSVQTGRIGFENSFLPPGETTDTLKALGPGQRSALSGGGYVERTSAGQLRATRPIGEFTEPVALEGGSGAVQRLDFRSSSSDELLVALREDGTLLYNTVTVTRPLGGGKPRTKLSSERVPFEPPHGQDQSPAMVMVTGDGSHVLCLWPTGMMQRYTRTGEGAAFVLAQTRSILGEGRMLTAAEPLLGSRTLITGDDSGLVQGLFVAGTPSASGSDGRELVSAHRFTLGAAAAGIGHGQRDRSFVVARRDGVIDVLHMTSHKLVASVLTGFTGTPGLVAIAPKYDGLIALSRTGELGIWTIRPGHPEVTLSSLFGQVWYENEPGPSYTYQSSSGEDTAEVKISQMPLIFGTLKATVYAMLFAVPVAILAAIYTSEILHPLVRSKVKPVIELMASMPSVVLGFVAALIIAPLVRDRVAGVLVALWVIPMAALGAAYLWQLLPIRVRAGVSSLKHLVIVLLLLGISSLAAGGLGSMVQRVLFTPSVSEQLVLAGATEPVPTQDLPVWTRALRSFTPEQVRTLAAQGLYVRQGVLVRPAGDIHAPATAQKIAHDHLDTPDIRLWLDGTIGTAWPGWFLIMTPAATILTVLLRARLVDRWLQGLPVSQDPRRAAWLELGKFALTVVVSIVSAGLIASLLSSAGLDVRDSVFGSFSQRNTLVVGIIMGFAIIPIIYTISEDSMSAVPGALRSASLGCGATKWQTAIRVVMPMALSGVFSACMIGLGRAAGETMIVLMATGNTPSMDWNIFSGFRTLAANIAVELPEAAEGSTHYRVLFLGGLILFGITFAVNTAAEVIRQRVRRKGAGL